MNYWLFKSEPDTFSIDKLKEVKKEVWDGVRNYQARNFLRDEVKKGDLILFYHSSCKVPGIAGIAKVSKDSVVDPTQFDKNSKYFDPKATKDSPRWITVEVAYKKKFKQLIDREMLKSNKITNGMMVMQKGSRLSIQPVSAKEYEEVISISK
jgi:predicted RNA-binding protein with PUA-like domain